MKLKPNTKIDTLVNDLIIELRDNGMNMAVTDMSNFGVVHIYMFNIGTEEAVILIENTINDCQIRVKPKFNKIQGGKTNEQCITNSK